MPLASQPAGRRERNKQQKLDRITAAARELFAERGVDEVTTQEIADKADIGAGTLFLYAGPPSSARWYDVAGPGEQVGARALVYLRRRPGVRTGPFREHVNELASTLADTGQLRELRTQVFLPWHEKLWDTPNVAHDNPVDQRFHASLILGFADPAARAAFFASAELASLSEALAPYASAAHAYDVTDALTFVKDGKALDRYER